MRYAMLAAVCMLSAASQAAAQTPVDAHWIWFDEGDPATAAPAGKVWFRFEVRADEPSTGDVRIACDDRFTLWINGQRIGTGDGDESSRYNLNGIVDRGVNVIAVEAENLDGRAGLLVEGEVRGQSGRAVSFDSSPQWKATRDEPAGQAWLKPDFDVSAWSAVKDLGGHEDSAWAALSFEESYLDRYQLPEGFRIERIGEPELVGSLVAITWGNRERLIASREKGPILSVIDSDDDKVYDRVVEYSTEVTNCQGLLTVGDVLYAVGIGPQGTGMYKLPDANRDDVADSVELITGYKGGMGEHGPHDIVLGPDGWLYHNLGNHAWIQHEPQPTSPNRNYYEGDLLRPRFEDPNGHAAGIPAPGGTVWRFSPDGQQWFLQTNGFRNHYDIGFNSQGELFTFDSDMEWEVGMPFYKPVRVAHCTEGAEYGWRSNAGKWLPYYLDALPAAVDVGRGSPTGVVFYEHHQFPPAYEGAFIVADWSMGHILAVHLKPNGASFGGEYTTLVSGNPLNVSDLEVAPDGSLVFSTGGRGTEGGLYRVTFPESNTQECHNKRGSIGNAIDMPQPAANWAREANAWTKEALGERWVPGLEHVCRNNEPRDKIRALTLLAQLGPPPSTELLIEMSADAAAEVRAFATWLLGDRRDDDVAAALAARLGDEDAGVQRRACEAFVRSGQEPPVEPLFDLMDSDDRFVRFHARLALERVPVEKWRDAALNDHRLRVQTHALLALTRLGEQAISPDDALAQAVRVVLKCSRAIDDANRLDALRLAELALINGAEGPARDDLCEALLLGFGRSAGPLAVPRDMEASRILCFLQAPEAAAKIVDALEKSDDQALQIHYAHVSAYLKAGWNPELNARLLGWYEGTRGWEGGHSFPRWLENIMAAHLAGHYPPDDRKLLLASWGERPYATRLLLQYTDPATIAGFDELVRSLVDELDANPRPGGDEIVAAAIDALVKSPSLEAQASLRNLFEQLPDRRDQIVRGMSQRPTAEDWPFLVRALDFGDNTTLQLAIGALRTLDQAPDKPAQLRAAIVAGLKLGAAGGLPAAALVQQWSGESHDPAAGAAAALAHYQAWFASQYPGEPAAELSAVDTDSTGYSMQQLLDHLVNGPGGSGDVARGKQVFVKANCAKCHRFGTDGEGVGPDLTTVRRRFQKREIVEALLAPSQVISDQYRSVTVLTLDGQIHSGLPLPQSNDERMVLLLPDAKKLEIPRSEIDEMSPSTVSVMPAGIIKELTLEDLADLFAFLETSKQNEEPPKQAAAGN